MHHSYVIAMIQFKNWSAVLKHIDRKFSRRKKSAKIHTRKTSHLVHNGQSTNIQFNDDDITVLTLTFLVGK